MGPWGIDGLQLVVTIREGRRVGAWFLTTRMISSSRCWVGISMVAPNSVSNLTTPGTPWYMSKLCSFISRHLSGPAALATAT